MTVGNLWSTRANTIVPLMNFTKSTKQMDFSAVGLITGTNWSTSYAAVIAYADSNGAWRLKFNIRGTIGSPANNITLTFASTAAVTFKNGPNQAISASQGTSAAVYVAYANVNSNTATLTAAFSSNVTDIMVSGDVALNSEPAWAAANMESVGNASAYISPASATVDGIVTTGTQVIAGPKTLTGNLSVDGGSFVFNEAGADKDFRVEGDTDANLLFCDASTDRVGIGTNAPLKKLDIYTSTTGNIEQYIRNNNLNGLFKVNGTTSFQIGTETDHHLQFLTNNTIKMTIMDGGNVGIGIASPAQALDVVGTIKTSVGISLPTSASGATPTTLDYNEEGTFDITLDSGIYTTGTTVTISFSRIGKFVTFFIPETLVTTNATQNYWGTTSASVPARLTSNTAIYAPCMFKVNGDYIAGICAMQSGYINFFKYDKSSIGSGTANTGVIGTLTFRLP